MRLEPWLFAFAGVVIGLSGCEAPNEKPEAPKASASAQATKPKPKVKAKLAPPALMNTATAKKHRAPTTYRVKLETAKGDAVVEVTRAWAPRGADRFHYLVVIGYYNKVPFYRVNFELLQWGIHSDPKVTQLWDKAFLLDEMVKKPNHRGRITFARRSSDTRTTHVFINLKDNSSAYDAQGFAPFGEVVKGMNVLDKLSRAHGDRTIMGDSAKRMKTEGKSYINKAFPKLDWLKRATIVTP